MNKTEKVINRRVPIASLSNEKLYRSFKIKSCSGTLSFHSISTLERLNNTTTTSRRTGKKSNTEVWISKTRTFHEPLHAFLYISQSSLHDHDLKLSKFLQVVNTRQGFSNSSLNLDTVSQNSISKQFTNIQTN